MLHALMLTQDLPQVDFSFQLCNVHWKYRRDYLNWIEWLPFSLSGLKPDQLGISRLELPLLIQTASPSQTAQQDAVYPQLLPSTADTWSPASADAVPKSRETWKHRRNLALLATNLTWLQAVSQKTVPVARLPAQELRDTVQLLRAARLYHFPSISF